MARLPAELTDIIIALLASDRAALGTCSLVCKGWLPASRRDLFSVVTLIPFTNRTRTLVELLTAPSSTIANYIRTVSIVGSPALRPLSTLAQPLEKLVAVEGLILVGRWSPVQEWEMERLSMWFAKITTLALRVETFKSPNEFFDFLRLFRSLRTLRLRGAYGLQVGGRDQRTFIFPSSLRVISIVFDRSLEIVSLIPPYVIVSCT